MNQNSSNDSGRQEFTAQVGQLTGRLRSYPAPLTPARLVEAAHEATPGVDAVGLTVLSRAGQPETAAATAALVRRIDHLQELTRQGPALDAADREDLVRVDDLSLDTRWPAFSTAVVRELNVHNVLSVRLHLGNSEQAALSFYAISPGVLTDRDAVAAATFATFLTLAVDAQQAREEAAQLRVALNTSRQIGTAIGILMARKLLTPDQAFANLREASQRMNRKLREVAFDVIESGELPGLPQRPNPPQPGPPQPRVPHPPRPAGLSTGPVAE